jgi:rubrerythrin
MSSALWDRWVGFLAKIERRHGELVAEAEAGLAQMVAADPAQVQAMGNTIQGIGFRLETLHDKVDGAWERNDDEFFDAGGGFVDRARDAREDMDVNLRSNWARVSVRGVANAYRAMWPEVEASMARSPSCTQCGATMEGIHVYKPLHSTCPFCNAVNQLFPEDTVRIYFEGAPHALGVEAALEQRFAVERHRREADRARRATRWGSEPVGSLDELARLERLYWERYGEVRRRLSGESEESSRELIESRMTQFRDSSLMIHQHWRRAKGL